MSVSEINFCIQCGNSVTGSKYCSKCGNEVASTTLFEKDKESDDKDAIDKLLKELKNKKLKKQKIFIIMIKFHLINYQKNLQKIHLIIPNISGLLLFFLQ